MKAVIQRVRRASVAVDDHVIGEIERALSVLVPHTPLVEFIELHRGSSGKLTFGLLSPSFARISIFFAHPCLDPSGLLFFLADPLSASIIFEGLLSPGRSSSLLWINSSHSLAPAAPVRCAWGHRGHLRLQVPHGLGLVSF